MLASGVTASVVNSTFEANSRPLSSEEGPVASLQCDATSKGAALRFHSCRFSDTNTIRTSRPAEVAVESRECRVLSNTFKPIVWDKQLSLKLNPWLLAPKMNEDGEVELCDACLQGEDAFQGLQFLSELDAVFLQAASDHADATGLPITVQPPLPDVDDFITVDPYPSDAPWSAPVPAAVAADEAADATTAVDADESADAPTAVDADESADAPTSHDGSATNSAVFRNADKGAMDVGVVVGPMVAAACLELLL